MNEQAVRVPTRYAPPLSSPVGPSDAENFSNFDRRITSIARNKAYSSAGKMLVRSGSRTLLVLPLYAIAEATRSPTLEHSVYM